MLIEIIVIFSIVSSNDVIHKIGIVSRIVSKKVKFDQIFAHPDIFPIKINDPSCAVVDFDFEFSDSFKATNCCFTRTLLSNKSVLFSIPQRIHKK